MNLRNVSSKPYTRQKLLADNVEERSMMWCELVRLAAKKLSIFIPDWIEQHHNAPPQAK